MDLPLWIGAAEAEDIFGVPAATVRQWARRRRLYPRGIDDSGRPLYATPDIVTILQARTGSPPAILLQAA
jgi:DNA-binding transcriptional MerR regulator